MIPVIWNDKLKADYRQLWDAAKIRPERIAETKKRADMIVTNKARYEKISKVTGVPWWFIGLIHNMECGLRFDRHLHNGDSLKARTVHVPAGRPVAGVPPFDFETSAYDALSLRKLNLNKDWSLEHCLYLLEGFNGYGYRQYHPTVPSPYLWSFTTVYTKGKYVADGKWDSNTVSLQIGIAALMKAMQVFP